MPAPIDATGQKYGRLTAIRVDAAPGVRRWVFRCDCGVEVSRPLGHVRCGKVSSCGCFRREVTAKNRARDFTGMIIGRLTVLGKSAERHTHNRIAWDCLCVCGVHTTRNSHALGKANPTLSCGCLRRELARQLGASSRQENPVSKTPEYKAKAKKRRRARPEVAMAERVSRMLAWALVGIGAVKSGKTFDMLGFTPAELKTHVEKQFLPGMSWSNRADWQLDHITPISSARSVADVVALNQLSNLRPMWSADNNAKKDQLLFLI